MNAPRGHQAGQAPTSAQAAHAAACAHQGIGADEAGALWLVLGNDDATYWAAIAEAVTAAQQPQAAPGAAQLRMALAFIEQVRDGAYGDLGTIDAEQALREIEDAAPAQPQPAPELAAAMAETRKVLGLLDDFTHALIDLDDGHGDQPARTAHAVRKKAGLPPVEGR